MKQLFTGLAIVILFGCTKQISSETIGGTWTIIETKDGSTGMGVQKQTYSPSSEITLEFGNDGNPVLVGSNPGAAKSPLREFDKYQVLEGNFVRLYQSTGNKEMKVYYEVVENLFLVYPDRHGYEEKFLRVK